MIRIDHVRELGLQFRLRALTVRDPALARELQLLAEFCEQKAALIDDAAPVEKRSERASPARPSLVDSAEGGKTGVASKNAERS
ncbi:MAG TPA: hypothetical protein VET85_04800 [Stellaceae bacterium]|nr:hypothetical protein [Stellaceae bacterium]